MNYFLDTGFSKEQPILNPEESKHALRSLRLTAGDELTVGDGKGHRYRCILTGVDNNLAKLSIEDALEETPPANKLTIGIAPTKTPSRFEWFLEKATELGIWSIIPIISQHSERPRINDKRARKIIHAASKQSQRFYIPELLPLIKLKDIRLSEYDHVYLAHCNAGYNRSDLMQLLKDSEGTTLILIGPEGDFSVDEIETLQKNKALDVSLGKNRLRTETAGVYAAAIYSSSIHLMP